MALPKIHRITKDKEYKFIFDNGRSFVTPYFVVRNVEMTLDNVIILPPFPKFGIIASKKIGKAVERNRAKRIMSEALRLEITKFKDNLVATFVCRGKILELTTPQIINELQKMKFLYK